MSCFQPTHCTYIYLRFVNLKLLKCKQTGFADRFLNLLIYQAKFACNFIISSSVVSTDVLNGQLFADMKTFTSVVIRQLVDLQKNLSEITLVHTPQPTVNFNLLRILFDLLIRALIMRSNKIVVTWELPII